MSNLNARPRVTSFAPQFLVHDLGRSIAYYQKIGVTFGEVWDGFYAIGTVDGLELHLKEATKDDAERQRRREQEHLDAASGVDGIEAFYAQCVANGVTILRPLGATAWGTKGLLHRGPGRLHHRVRRAPVCGEPWPTRVVFRRTIRCSRPARPCWFSGFRCRRGRPGG